MAHFAVIVSWVAILGILVGLVSPKKSLFWYFGNRSRLNVLIIYGLLLLLSFVVFAVTAPRT